MVIFLLVIESHGSFLTWVCVGSVPTVQVIAWEFYYYVYFLCVAVKYSFRYLCHMRVLLHYVWGKGRCMNMNPGIFVV